MLDIQSTEGEIGSLEKVGVGDDDERIAEVKAQPPKRS